jgi:DNA-binding winged helix-turn-helix (wHTH) protein/serine/threonine protein kinase
MVWRVEGRAAASAPQGEGRRIWRFGTCAFDERSWRLTVDGEAVDLEIKPLQILLELLRRPGEVVTKDELLEAVWPATTVVEGSLTTALSKLRRALGRHKRLIETSPRLGYRFAGGVEAELLPAAPEALPFKSGSTVPGRRLWRLARRLGTSPANEVWLAENAKTGERRVFKFAAEPAFLRNLRREVSLARFLAASLGDRPDLAPVLEWNFEGRPFFVEWAYRGEDLHAWAAAQGGLGQVPRDVRLELAAQIAATVAAAHDVGVLHRDLKPGNVVVAPEPDGGWRAALVDFGSADLAEPHRLAHLRITDPGFGDGGYRTGGSTAHYRAPELLAGAPPTAAADIFALGVILYQLAVGDLDRPLVAGWEAAVGDPLLAEDIAAAAAGDPADRLASAAELASRLRRLPERRLVREAEAAAALRRAATEQALMRARARRPWIVAAGVALSAGVVASTAMFAQARHDRDLARRQTEIARLANDFLASDLLARSSPFRSARADETLLDAVKAAAPGIDRRFAGEPAVAAELHQTLARAFDRRSDWDAGRAHYRRAEAYWRRAEGPDSVRARIVRLQTAMMEARSYQEGGLERARAILAAEEPAIAALRAPPPDLVVWRASARGMLALIENDAVQAEAEFGRAATAAEASPELFDLGSRLTFLQRRAFALIRLGEGARAEAIFRRLADEHAAMQGPEGGDVLMLRMNIVQALMIQGRHAEAVAEADRLHPQLARILGADHEMTLQLRATRAQSNGALERWDAAIEDATFVHATAMRKQGPASFFAIASRVDGATAKCRSGRRAEALRELAEARAYAHRGFPNSGLEGGVNYAWAECLIAAGRPDEAATRLRGVNVAAVAQLIGDPSWGANAALAHARIADARGDAAGVRARLAEIGAAFDRPTADRYLARIHRQLRARYGD